MTSKADAAAGRAADSDGLDHAIRFGFVVYGIVHLTFGWLAAQLAFGQSSGEASGTGALQQLAEQPLGGVVLWVVAAGMALLVVWRLLEAVAGHRGEDGAELWRHRLVDLGKAAIYAVLAYSAVSTVVGASSGSSDQSSRSLSGRVMELPAGQWLVGAIGVGILVVAGFLVRRGLTESFMEDLDADGHRGADSRAYRLLGKVGYVAKGVTVGIVGVLFVVAAAQHDPSESGGTDQALRQLLEQPFGSFVLLAMAAGIASFGLFCFAKARHLSR